MNVSTAAIAAKQEHNGHAGGAITFGGDLLDRTQNYGEHLTVTLRNICPHKVQVTGMNLC